jgi:agmatine deiminase
VEETPLTPTPASLGFSQPAEWLPHQACWLAFPSPPEWQGELLEAARAEFVDLCRAIADPDPVTGVGRGEQLEVLVHDAEMQAVAASQLAGIPVRFHQISYGDLWLRDIGPIFLTNPQGALATVRFKFNGWGEKYLFPDDLTIAATITDITGVPGFEFPFILEGGAIETDGEGTCLTTRQCLLNPNRNPHLSQADLEAGLQMALGFQKVLWLDSGLQNDHTDGHIDTLARFVAPEIVLCMLADDANDPNAAALQDIADTLAGMTDAQGRPLKVVTIPSPGKILDQQGEIMPASYLNFYIGNRRVVVPTYGSPADQAAVAAIAQHFPDRQTVGCSARAILYGGGAFHCITQQQPRASKTS